MQLVDGTHFEIEAAGRTGPFLVAQCWSRDVLSRVKLAVDAGESEPARAVLLHHLGLDDEAVLEVAWADLDRSLEPDHLTSVFIDRLAAPVSAEMARLEELVRTLRERCPWDREQTHASLTRHLVEETYEVLDAIAEVTSADEADDPGLDRAVSHLEEELGDLLFQVYFHSRLASERGWFTLADVAAGVHDKLVGRHPHVFGDVTATTPGAVAANWEMIKAAEKGRESVTDGIPTALPDPERRDRDEPGEARVDVSGSRGEGTGAEGVGNLLYAVVALAAELGVDAEEALRGAALDDRDRIVAREREALDREEP